MKIKGFYILTRRSIARMIAVMATAFVMLCNAVTTKDEPLVNRIRSTSIALYALDGEIDGRSTRTVVPAVHYIEYKSVYLEAKRYNKEHGNPAKAARRDASPHHAAVTQRLRHSRRGSGLKGKRTERMVEQLADFTAWLRGNPINERDPARTVGARASLFWRLHEKTFKRDAVRVGEKRGFGSEKTLAAAFRNSKA